MKTKSGAKFDIRAASLKDAHEIADLSAELGYPTSKQQTWNRLQRLQKHPYHAIFVVEITDGPIVGWIHVFLRPLLITELGAAIGGIVIQESCRRQGLGKELIRHAEIWAQDQGCQKICLYSAMHRKTAHTFYANIGYTRTKSSWKYEKELSRS